MSSQIRLAFFGSSHAFDYHHIGGTDSLIRRLSFALIHARVCEVDLITYGHTDNVGQQTHYSGLRSLRCRDLGDAFEALRRCGHVVTVYLPPRDRPQFMLFRARMDDRVRFHMLFQSWPDSSLKRRLMISDAVLAPYNGCVFGVSPRLVKYIRRWIPASTLLLPPVPHEYFVPLSLKSNAARIRVTFLGRVDPGKGVIETVQIFNELSSHPDVELLFCGMYWPRDSDSVRLHEILLEQKRFRYVPVSFGAYTEAIDKMVQSTLANSDILLQPYRKLSSTIDTPLLLLEAMASLTPTITKPYGDIPRIYGKSVCLVEDSTDVVEQILQRIYTAKKWLSQERTRIAQQNKTLCFDVQSVAKVFANALGIG